MTTDGDDDHQRLALCGELDIDNAVDLEQELRRIQDGGATRIVVDLSELRSIDSISLRVLLHAYARSRASLNDFELIRGPAQVQRLFELTGLEEALPFVD